jgi:hypothetical protein
MSQGDKQGIAPPGGRPPAGPQAAAYGAGAAARTAGPAKYGTPRAGGPPPPIPPLDGPPGEGMTMAAMAMAQRQPPRPPGSILTTKEQMQGPDIRPTDLLPAEAQSDAGFIQGSGSMYAAAQPALAMKYGVVREGRRIPPQQLMARQQGPGGQPRAPLRTETIEGLKKLGELASNEIGSERAANAAAEKESEQGPAGRAAAIGLPPGSGGEGGERLSDEEIKKRLAGMDEFDLNNVHEMMVKDIINNEEQRKIVEARLEPLNLADLVVNFTVTQRVPIIPGVFEVEYESTSGEDDLCIKKMLVEEAKSLKVDDRYLLDKYSLMGLACAVKSINGKPLGSHRDNEGNFNEEALDKKFKRLLKMPLPMLAAIGPHYFWFDMRVRKLFVAETIKNG